MHQDYPEPVKALFSYGEPRTIDNSDDPSKWPDYLKEFGLSLNDVPHLIRMLDDPILNSLDSKDPRAWADIHAWRALGQLGAVDAIPDLIHCLDYDDDLDVSDWKIEEIPEVLGRIGPLAIEPLIQHLEDDTKGLWSRTAAANGLVHIAEIHPESRLDCIKAITYGLETLDLSQSVPSWWRGFMPDR
jgi:HEAT repeat protein